MPICNPTIQLVVANLYTKFEVSILNGYGDIFDEKSGEKEQELKSNSIARLKRCLFKAKKSFWQSFMKTGSKLCRLDSTHGFLRTDLMT